MLTTQHDFNIKKMERVKDTSLLAFEEVRITLGERQKVVLEAIGELREATNTMIARKLWLPINCITPRTNELVKKGLVIEAYRDKCPLTKRKAIWWKTR